MILPICIDEKHWVLGVFNIESMRMTVHDTLWVGHLQEQLQVAYAIFINSLKELYLQLGDMARAHRAINAELTFAMDTPRQSGHLGDCRPWVYRLLSQFTVGVMLGIYSKIRIVFKNSIITMEAFY